MRDVSERDDLLEDSMFLKCKTSETRALEMTQTSLVDTTTDKKYIIIFNYLSLSFSLLLSLIFSYLYIFFLFYLKVAGFSLFEDLCRAERLFDRTFLYGYELSSFFPLQTLTIIFYEWDIVGMMMIMT